MPPPIVNVNNNSTLSAVLCSARSNVNKVYDVCLELFSTCLPDLIFITETWLHKDDIFTRPAVFNSFNVLRCDRLNRGGGMATCIRDSISHSLISTLCVHDGTLECLCFDIYLHSSRCVRFILVYRSPSGSINTINVLVDSLSRNIPFNHNSRCVILGDFNLPSLVHIISSNNYHTVCDTLTHTFVDFCTHCGLLQHETSPTRGINTLDLVFTPNLSGIISNVCISMPVCTSDHSTVSFNLCSIRNTNGVSYNVRSFFSKFNISLAHSLLSNVDWHVIFNNCLSIEDYWTAFKMTCLDFISRSTPVSAHTFRRNPIPRILHRAIIKKRRLWRRYVSHTSSSSLAAFKAQSGSVSSLYRIHRSRHELRILLTYSNQNFWRFCSKRISSSNSCFPLSMTYSGLTVTDLASLPNTFNSFFTSIFNANPPNGTLPFRHNVYIPL